MSSKHRMKSGGLPHVGLDLRALNEDPWQGLSGPAKIFYVQLKSQHNGSNNGKIRLPYSKMRSVKGCANDPAISKAIKELRDKGWIKVVKKGGLYRYNNLFRLTFKYEFYGKN